MATQQEYGVDQVFVNGISYYNKYPQIGHPYLLDNKFEKGSVIFRGKLYSDVLLMYDICFQKLLIKYAFNDDQFIFYLTKEFISEFNIYNKRFVKGSYYNLEKDRFYQIIGENIPIKVLYKWEKIQEKSDYYLVPYQFSSDRRSCFIYINNKLIRYKGNSSFIHKFPKQNQKLIKKYIRSNKIKVKYCSDNEMELLLKYSAILYP
ncbi:MAG: hypothetical protein R6W78_14850 [Bacteroidales bacterium]